ncbi:hypothetical protein ACF0H5_011806 [Mactra antiquata]
MRENMSKIKIHLKLLFLLSLVKVAEGACPNPAAPINGRVSVSGTFAGYTCDKGYELNGTNYLICLSNDKWDDDPPTCDTVDCGNPLIPTNGGTNYTTTTYLSQAEYYCDTGYNVSGSTSALCRASGSWSSTVPTCTLVDCGDPQGPLNGGVNYTSTTYSSSISYFCDTGYTLDGNDTDMCDASGVWLNGSPTCNIVDCASPEIHTNGGTNHTTTTYLSQADYYCNTGYELSGATTASCQASGFWSDGAPNCTIVDCENPPMLYDGGANYTTTTYLSQAEYYCNTGYELSGATNITCQASGNWSDSPPDCIIVDCLEPTGPLNGGVNFTITTYLTKIDYYCGIGYELVSGNDTDVCDASGNWVNGPPTCSIVDCASPEIPSNGGTNHTTTTYLSQADYYCNTGYELSGATTASCQASGFWSDGAPNCTIVDCENPLMLYDGGANYTTTTYLSQAEYYCNTGYELSGATNITCQASGNWSDSPPDCIIVDCLEPTGPLNGGVNFTITTYLTTIDYYCDIGYELVSGNDTDVCDASGNWVNGPPTCSIVDCASPEIPTNGGTNYTTTTYLSQAEYYCNTGYELSGATNASCQASGFWSDGAPNCTIVDCGSPDMPVNGGANYSTTTYLSQADYYCDTGYDLSGPTYALCEESSSWSASPPTCTIFDCGNLTSPADGFIFLSGTVYDSVASYTCDTGYYINEGNNVRFCDASGNWTGTEATCAIVDCGEPTPAVNGGVNYTSTEYDSWLEYVCDVGYNIDVATNASCLDTGSWSTDAPNCTIVDCGRFQTPTNGGTNYTTTTYLSQIDYYCDTGYELFGPTSALCLASETWSDSPPNCTIVDCLEPTGPLNGGVNFTITTYLTMIDYYCDIGYNLISGNDTDVCDASGNWVNGPPTCTIVDCASPEIPTNGGTNYTTTTYLSQADYYCNTGYELSGATTASCHASGFWSDSAPNCTIVDCGSPDTPLNGGTNYSTTTYLSQADYYCDTGYDLSGPTYAFCEESSSWSASPPTCTIVDCGNVTAPVNGFIFATGTEYSSVVSYTCGTGYNLTGGDNVRFCDASGNWTGTAPTCVIVDCGEPTAAVNGGVNYTSTEYDSWLEYVCDVGYNIDVATNASCLDTGSWSADAPNCTIVDCGRFQTPINGGTNYTTTTYLSQIDYYCDTGYELFGSTSALCQASETWSDSPPNCTIVDCFEPTGPLNGGVNFTITTYLTTIDYYCDIGYELISGNDTDVCDAFGNWINGPPNCTIVDCASPEVPFNGGTNHTSTTYLSQADYYCNTGYELSGATSASCQASGFWSDGAPNCTIVDCESPNTPVNGGTNYSTTTYLSQADYYCDTGYDLSGPTYALCEESSSWNASTPTCTIVDCGNVTAPVDGFIFATGTVYSSVVSYTCDTGYDLTGGDNVRFCDASGNWTGTAPTCVIVDCNSLSAPTDGSVNTENGTTYGFTAIYSCVTGYNMTGGDVERTCELDGNWTGIAPQCLIVDCDIPVTPSNGAVNFTTTTYGSFIEYSCIVGHHLNGSYNATCEESGSWSSGSDLSCNIAECGAIATTIVNGTVNQTGTQYGDTSIYLCDNEYMIEPGILAMIINCTADGNWDGDVPSCVEIDCDELPKPLNGQVNTDLGTGYLDVASYTCDEGYVLSGRNIRSCELDALWDGSEPVCNLIDCGNLTDPSDGTVIMSGTTYLHTAVYTCSQGHEIVNGSESRTCIEDDIWNGTQPNCERKDCGDLSPPDNGQVHYHNTSLGMIAAYTCDPGYFSNDKNHRLCEEDGFWSDSPLKCRKKNCGSLSNPANGSVDFNSTLFEDMAVYSCLTGYQMVSGSLIVTCTEEGIWNDTEPVCELWDCRSLSNPTDGSVDTSNGTLYLATAIYSCREGFALLGFTSVQCLDGGTWSDSSPSCVIYDCGPLDDPVNGHVNTSEGTTYSATAVYTCELGYELRGSTDLFCQANGTWSNDPPLCILYDCGEPENVNNSVLSNNVTTYSGVVIYTCDEGYYISSGDSSRSCQHGGSWYGTTPVCSLYDCSTPGNLTNGLIVIPNGMPTLYQDIVIYECNPGYIINDTSNTFLVSICLHGGVWSEETPKCDYVDCGSLYNPSNGEVTTNNGTGLYSVATYICFPWYEMLGDDNRMCQANGQWSGREPLCKPVLPPRNMDCGFRNEDILIGLGISSNTTAVEFGIMKEMVKLLFRISENVRIGLFTFSDADFYSMPIREYRDKNEFYSAVDAVPFNESTTSPLLEYAFGYILTAMENGEFHNENRYEFPDYAFLVLDDYTILSNHQRLWDSLKPIGVQLVYVTIGLGENVYNATEENDEVLPVDSYSELFMMSQSIWSRDDRCDCGIPRSPLNGDVTVTGSYFMDTAMFSCDDGYKMVGFDKMSCRYGGIWSDFPPTCQPELEECGFVDVDLIIAVSVSEHRNQSDIAIHKAIERLMDRSAIDEQLVNFYFFMFDSSVTNVINMGDHSADDVFDAIYDLATNNSSEPAVLVTALDKISEILNQRPAYKSHENVIVYIFIDTTVNLTGSVQFAQQMKDNNVQLVITTLGYPIFATEINYLFGLTTSIIPLPDAGYLTNVIDGLFPNETCNCGEISDPENGLVMYNGTQFLDRAIFECNQGYEMVGYEEIRCQLGGYWSRSPPLCVHGADMEYLDMSCGFQMVDVIVAVGVSNITSEDEFDLIQEMVTELVLRSAIDEQVTQMGYFVFDEEVQPHSVVMLNEVENREEMLKAINGTSYRPTSGSALLHVAKKQIIEMLSGSRVRYPGVPVVVVIFVDDGVDASGVTIFSEVLDEIEARVIINTIGLTPYHVMDLEDLFVGYNRTVIRSYPSFENLTYTVWFDTEFCGCTDTIDLRHGSVSLSGTQYLDTATVQCDPGFTLVGPEKLVCLYNGSWSGSQPFCKLIGVPPSLDSVCGYRDIDIAFAFGVSTSIDEQEFTAMKNVAKHVIAVSDIDSGSVRISFIVFDTVIHYQTQLDDPLMSRSHLHGVIDNMRYQPSSAYKSILTVGCGSALTVFSSPGNNPYTPDILVMIVDSNVYTEDSISHMDLAKRMGLNVYIIAVGYNNSMDLYEIADVTEYTSFAELQTKAARWYRDPSCYCPGIAELDNGTVIMEGRYFLDTASFSCDPDFELVGSRQIQCMYDGQWSGPTPVCRPKAPEKTMDLVLRLNVTATPDLNSNDTYNTYMEAVRIALIEHYGAWMKNRSIDIIIKSLRSGSLIVSFTVNVPNDVESAESFAQATSKLATGSEVTVLNDTLSATELLFGTDSVDLSTIDITQATCITFEEVNGPCNVGYICQMVNGTVPTCLPDPNTDCGYPGTFLNGYFEITDGTILGKAANYSCNTGYNLNGSPTRHCGVNGAWQPDAPTCQPVDCGSLLPPLNGFIVGSQGTTFGNMISFSCDGGYITVGTDTLTCMENGNWSTELPSCQIIPDYCGNVSTPDNGAISYSNDSLIDSVVTFECNTGYTLSGVTSRMCSNTGNWEPQLDTTCLIKDCGSLTAPENGYIDINKTTYGEVASFTCQPEYVLAGERSLTCTHNGNWSSDAPLCYPVAEFCRTLLDPVNGRQTISVISSTDLQAVFFCNTGYKLSGPDTRTCSSLNGTWIPDEATTCMLHDCGLLFNPENGNVDQSAGTTYGQVVYYSCSAGYQLFGEEQAVCNADGQWSNPPPVCQVTNCGGLAHPQNGIVTAETTTFGQMAVYTCNNGYDISGVTRRICLTDGSWSGKEPDCFPKDCGPLFAPINGDVDMSEGTLYGSTVYYSCENGYELNGAEQTTCSESGIWQPARSPKCDPTLCPLLSHPDNGILELTQGISYGSVATYSCNTGYILIGSETKLCTADTLWYPTMDVTCVAVDCGRLPELSNGNIIYDTNTTVYGDTASFSCNHGYILSVNPLFSTICMENSNWDLRTMPTCSLVDCGRPSVIMNGNRIYTRTTYDSVAVYTCHAGYEINTDNEIQCMASGSWSTAPSCDRIDCGDLQAPEFGSVVFTDGTLYNSGATFTCQTGYELTGPEMKICSSNKMWLPAENPSCSILDCDFIQHPENGFVDLSSGTTYGQTATFLCNVGYARFGARQVLCTNTGDWSAQPPICQVTDCGGLQNPENGIVTSEQTTLSQEATYTCDPGYTIQGTSIRICQSNGSWSDSIPTCQPKDCGILEAPENGDVIYNSNTLYGSTVDYKCNDGYIVNGLSTRTCLHTRQWSDVAPSCDRVDCGERPVLEDGYITDSSPRTTLDSEVFYECDTGYKMMGTRIVHCLTTGQWSQLPTCRIEDCGRLVHPDNGEVIVQGHVFGDSALYQCDVGYRMIGVPTRQCQSNGEWSGIQPFCQIVDCGPIQPPENGFIEHTSGTDYKSFVVFDCDPLHEKIGPSAVVCRADGHWSNQPTTCNLIDGYVSEKVTLHLNMTVDAEINFDNDTVYRSYQTEVKNQLLLHYITELAESNINVVVKSLRFGSLIVSYTVVLPDNDVSRQEYSTATQSLAHGSIVTVFGDPLSATRMVIDDDNVDIVPLSSDEVKCQLYIQISGRCEHSHICVVENNVPQCRLWNTKYTSKWIYGFK